ncbi:MAG: Mth938-like domain-containing protein [Rhodospirillaceae bacterium]|jgi:uncharacterized protein|nr:Mth938-like domain-containing protein [Rhodospirillaceae bacterium]
MELTRIAPKDRQYIQKYNASGFTVSSIEFSGPILVFADVSLPWTVESLDPMAPLLFETVFERAGRIDLCLLGCGKGMRRVPREVRALFKDHGIGIEAMDTGAACRTFNVLLAEGRSLAAALIPPVSHV